MKVLSIGNSFSCDAHRYLYELAKEEGVEIETTNLYIGGCSLEMHFENLINDSKNYLVYQNGYETQKYFSINEALLSDDWDVVTLQQVSFKSIDFKSYTPFLESIAKTIRNLCPRAKVYIHQTWAYENKSDLLHNLGFKSDEEMFYKIKEAYLSAVEVIRGYKVIPCGEAMLKASKEGIKVHRDGFHASLGVGRYILALTWFKALTGLEITNNSFDRFDEPITEQERKIAIKAVDVTFSEKGH